MTGDDQHNQAESTSAADGEGTVRPATSTPKRAVRIRRATLPAPPGTDASPEDPITAQRESGENDERLAGDKPPHWG